MSLVVKDGISPSLSEIAREFPREFQKARMDLGSRYRRLMAQELRSGSPAGSPLAPLSPITLALREGKKTALNARRRAFRLSGGSAKSRAGARLTRTAAATKGFGGRLPDIDEYKIEGDTLRIGWLGGVFSGSDRAMRRFEMGAKRPFTTAQRRMLHVMLGKGVTIPTDYSKPDRPAVGVYLPQFSEDAYQTIVKSIRARLIASARRS